MILCLLVFLSGNLGAQDLDAGKALFRENCQSCHNGNMKAKMTGPALGGVEERWEGYEEDLYRWIRNSSALIAEGQPKAVEIANEYDNSPMTSFPNITDDDISNILAYVQRVFIEGPYPKPIVVDDGPLVEKASNNTLYYGLLALLAILAVVLARVISNLNYMVQLKDGTAPTQRKSLLDSLMSKSVIGFVLFGLLVLAGYFTVNNAIDLGRQQDYAPEQPIAFSHETHAGLNEIDCQYCHDGARRSKHSVIPAANTCMNCHKAIKIGSKYGTAELTKIYASIGFNPNTDKYIDDIENKSNDDLEEIYKEWITDNYLGIEELKELDSNGEQEIEDQWDNIVSSLTNETKPKITGPIEWIRIHNLPDHVYFNHAQHVSVGEVKCQTCHGPVEEMEVLAQHSPLSMGWCINCHRESDVKFSDNEYYTSYQKYHDEIANGTRKSVTVEDIGGLECQKCHY